MSDEEEVSLEQLRAAAARAGQSAKERAARHGGTRTYAVNGRLVRESPEGQTVETGTTKAILVRVTKRKWKLH